MADPVAYLARWRDRGTPGPAAGVVRAALAETLRTATPGTRRRLAAETEPAPLERALGGAVDRAIATDPGIPPTSAWWTVIGLAQTIATGALVLGAVWVILWILIKFPADAIVLPVVGQVPIPLVALVVSLVVGYLLARLLGLHAGWLGRRWADRLAARIRDGCPGRGGRGGVRADRPARGGPGAAGRCRSRRRVRLRLTRDRSAHTARNEEGSMNERPSLPPEPGPGLPPPPPGPSPAGTGLDDPRALQILATEHWSLLSSRSLIWNESFARAGLFLSLLSASVVALSLIGTDSPDFLSFALVLLPVTLFVGVATFFRLDDANREEALWMAAMNRIRHAYVTMVPAIAERLVSGYTDDPHGHRAGATASRATSATRSSTSS